MAKKKAARLSQGPLRKTTPSGKFKVSWQKCGLREKAGIRKCRPSLKR
jgi:hypothetical protein